jgi:hypothetical protein
MSSHLLTTLPRPPLTPNPYDTGPDALASVFLGGGGGGGGTWPFPSGPMGLPAPAPAMFDLGLGDSSLLGTLAALLPPPLASSVAAAMAQQQAAGSPGVLSVGGLSATTTGAGGAGLMRVMLGTCVFYGLPCPVPLPPLSPLLAYTAFPGGFHPVPAPPPWPSALAVPRRPR